MRKQPCVLIVSEHFELPLVLRQQVYEDRYLLCEARCRTAFGIVRQIQEEIKKSINTYYGDVTATVKECRLLGNPHFVCTFPVVHLNQTDSVIVDGAADVQEGFGTKLCLGRKTKRLNSVAFAPVVIGLQSQLASMRYWDGCFEVFRPLYTF